MKDEDEENDEEVGDSDDEGEVDGSAGLSDTYVTELVKHMIELDEESDDEDHVDSSSDNKNDDIGMLCCFVHFSVI